MDIVKQALDKAKTQKIYHLDIGSYFRGIFICTSETAYFQRSTKSLSFKNIGRWIIKYKK